MVTVVELLKQRQIDALWKALRSKKGEFMSGEIYDRFKANGGNYGYRTFRRHLDELFERGILSVRLKTGRGICGNSMLWKLRGEQDGQNFNN